MHVTARLILALTISFTGALASAARGEDRAFDFSDPKGVNCMTFVLDSLVEPIMGLATGVSGTIQFDPANPKGLSGRLVVDSKNVKTSLDAMTKVLHGEDWMDVAKHKTVELVFKRVTDVKSSGDNATSLTVVGDFTCKGVTKEVTVKLTATYLADELKNRLRGTEGDLLVLRSNFTIKRTDFGIKPEMGGKVVANEIEIRVSIVGYSKK